MLVLLAMLPGYSPESEGQSFPAPFEEPVLAVYHNFSSSGIYDPDPHGDRALASLTQELEAFMPLNHAWLSTTRQYRIDFLKKHLIDDEFRPAELFFFFKNPEKFALILCGTFNPDKLAQVLSATNSPDNNSAYARSFSLSGISFYLELSNDKIILMPESSSQEGLERLKSPDATLSKKFSAFASMLKGKPALAAEIDFQALNSSIASFGSKLPRNFALLQHLRLIADDQLAKIQLFVPEAEKKLKLSQNIDLSQLERIVGSPGSLQMKESGKSLFIEAEAGKALEESISHKFSAMLIHFFLKRSFKYEVAALDKENNEQLE